MNGQIVEADGKMLYLDHMGLDKVEVIDSVRLDAEGQFSFSPAAPKDCFDFYRLRVDCNGNRKPAGDADCIYG